MDRFSRIATAIAIRSGRRPGASEGVFATSAATAVAAHALRRAGRRPARSRSRAPSGPSATARFAHERVDRGLRRRVRDVGGPGLRRRDVGHEEDRSRRGAQARAPPPGRGRTPARGPARKTASQSASVTAEKGFGIHGEAAWTRASRRGERRRRKRGEEKISSNSLMGAPSAARSAWNASARAPSFLLRRKSTARSASARHRCCTSGRSNSRLLASAFANSNPSRFAPPVTRATFTRPRPRRSAPAPGGRASRPRP